MRPFTRTRDGIRVRLSAAEADVLRMVPDLLASVGELSDDPAEVRLDVAVYPDDVEAAEEFRRLMSSEMESSRSADRSAFTVALDAVGDGPVQLSHDEAEAWLTVLGEARLVLASRLGIEEEGWGDDPALEEEPAMAMLHYLSWLQGSLVSTLMGRL